MFKKCASLFLCLILIFAIAACGKGDTNSPADNSVDSTSSSQPQPPEPVKIINPLTGLSGLASGKENARPVAVMINNISIAQPVQTGLNQADIVYETEVEGGITRLMAVFKDISAVGQIGTVRSARYPYVDLALGHNALYLHCGADPLYCAPHLNDIDHVSIDTGICGGKRVSNGLSREHTLYTFGADAFAGLKAMNFNMTQTSNENWLDFADEDATVTLTGGACTSVSIPFSTSYKTVFNYDLESGLYIRSFKNTIRKDYMTGEAISAKNVFVLMTTISNYSDNYHRKVALEGGDGYYITNGTYTPIKWSKAGENSPIKFTHENGADLKVSAGRSWVCIADRRTSQPTIQ